MIVADVMTKEVATCRPETNLAAASALMWENDCGALPVLADTGEVAGMLTDRDICIALGTRDRRSSEVTAREAAATHALVCKPKDDIGRALQIMQDARIRRLPVVDEDGALKGIVSIGDIVLSVRGGFARQGFSVSPKDVLAALQAIYTCDAPVSGESAAA